MQRRITGRARWRSLPGARVKLAIVGLLASLLAALLAPIGLPARALANACTLFTAADAKTALGAAVSPGVYQPLGQDQQCRYSTPSLSKTLSVSFHPLVKSDFQKLVEADDLKPIAGTSGPTYTTPGGLTAWKHGTQVSVVIRPPGGISLRTEEKLVAHVLARL